MKQLSDYCIYKRVLLVFVLFIIFCNSAYSYPIKVLNTKDSTNIGIAVEYLEDKDALLTLNDVINLNNENKFKTSSKVPLNFGYSPYTYWVSFSVLGETVSKSGWILEVPYAPLDYLTLYLPDGKGNYEELKSGDKTPFENKQIKFKNAAFVLGDKLLPYQQYFLKVSSSGSINLPLFLWTGSGFTEHVNRTQTGIGIFFGILFALMFTNTFLYMSTRDKDFLIGNLVIVSFSLVQASYNGMAAQFLWPDFIWWANKSMVIFAVLIFFSIAIFTNSFLKLKEHSPVLHRIMLFFIGFYSLMFIVVFVVSYRYASLATALVAIVMIFTVFIAAMVIYARGYKPARFFLLAWTFFLLGMSLLLLKLIGVLPHVFITEYSVQIGFTMNALLLSFALADRVNILRREKESAQDKALEHLEESERIKSRFLSETEKLVEKRTIELEGANKKLVELASIDVLTGLSNRRIFNEVIDKEFQRAKRSRLDISLIILDLDFFKDYNDSYGHLGGDACLTELAGIFRSCISRATDTIARYGGEEFAIILCDTNSEGAEKIAENIRRSVEEACIPHKRSPMGYVTISCGVASRTPMMSDRLEDFINNADSALYKAKSSGRNCVKLSSD